MVRLPETIFRALLLCPFALFPFFNLQIFGIQAWHGAETFISSQLPAPPQVVMMKMKAMMKMNTMMILMKMMMIINNEDARSS